MRTTMALTSAWAALHTFQYGFAIASLNGIQAVLTCGGALPPPSPVSAGYLSPCVSMTPAQFGLVVAIFTLGGLVGSLSSRALVARVGQRGALRYSALAVTLGSMAVALANNVGTMVAARVVIGLGCGVATTTVPLVLADLAPPGAKKALGIMNQLFIVLGILAAQALSFPLGKASIWRGVPAIAVLVGALQLLGSCVVHLPGDAGDDETTPLLGGQAQLTIAELLASRDPQVTRGLPLVLITQFFQQACGPSVVMYFSTSILSAVLPGSAKVIALAIVVLKVPITISPAFLIERLGTRPLLLLPTCVMTGAMLALAAGLNSGPGGGVEGGGGALAVAGMVAFVSAFSVGLGPVTWVVLGEVMPPHARTAASSLGLAINWSTNFLLGATFLPLQHYLAGNPEVGKGREGNIFYLFAGACAAAVLAIRWGYKVYGSS